VRLRALEEAKQALKGGPKKLCKGRRMMFITKDIPGSVFETNPPLGAAVGLISLKISQLPCYVSVLNLHLTENKSGWHLASGPGTRKQVRATSGLSNKGRNFRKNYSRLTF
jgi:hypothetical protein